MKFKALFVGLGVIAAFGAIATPSLAQGRGHGRSAHVGTKSAARQPAVRVYRGPGYTHMSRYGAFGYSAFGFNDA